MIWAELTGNPGYKERKRKGAAAQGLRYEKRFGKYLKQMGWEPRTDWISFIDLNGKGLAHPDYFLVFPHAIVLFECKLSQTDTAFLQINGLYRPLLSFIFKRPIVGVQVCKNLRYAPDNEIEDPFAVVNTTEEKTYTMHWLGL